MNKAFFLDRDGTINIDKGYVHTPEEFEFIEGVIDAIKAMNDAGYLVIVITNQAGIARGYYTVEEMHALHKYINEELEKFDAKIDAFYYCPHHPVHGIGELKTECDCRKPNAGMLRQAISDFDIDVSISYLIGDKPWDVEAGKRVGVRGFLVDSIRFDAIGVKKLIKSE